MWITLSLCVSGLPYSGEEWHTPPSLLLSGRLSRVWDDWWWRWRWRGGRGRGWRGWSWCTSLPLSLPSSFSYPWHHKEQTHHTEPNHCCVAGKHTEALIPNTLHQQTVWHVFWNSCLQFITNNSVCLSAIFRIHWTTIAVYPQRKEAGRTLCATQPHRVGTSLVIYLKKKCCDFILYVFFYIFIWLSISQNKYILCISFKMYN